MWKDSYIGSICVSQHCLEGSGSSELFVQGAINQVGLFGKYNIEQSGARMRDSKEHLKSFHLLKQQREGSYM